MKSKKRFLMYFIALYFLLSSIQFPVYADQNLTGREIMEKADEENETDDSTYLLTMEIRRDSSKRVRKMKMWIKSDEQGNDRSLIRFRWPPEVKGTGFLTIEHSDRDDDQWLYLPALKKVRRIASSKKGGSFMGSDFAYADIGGGDIDDYHYKLIGSEVIDGKDCYVIEETPATEKIKKDEGYGKRVTWIRKDIFYRAQVKYYDRHGNYLKIMKMSNFTKIEEADVWIAMHVVMTNEQKKGNETVIAYDEIEVNTGIADDFFTQRYLTKE
ncbi:outer membrane lipoprotein-sorting protein [bacterium]|nr:outer membrane lipoprotein-sorting protein [bacterium]